MTIKKDTKCQKTQLADYNSSVICLWLRNVTRFRDGCIFLFFKTGFLVPFFFPFSIFFSFSPHCVSFHTKCLCNCNSSCDFSVRDFFNYVYFYWHKIKLCIVTLVFSNQVLEIWSLLISRVVFWWVWFLVVIRIGRAVFVKKKKKKKLCKIKKNKVLPSSSYRNLITALLSSVP